MRRIRGSASTIAEVDPTLERTKHYDLRIARRRVHHLRRVAHRLLEFVVHVSRMSHDSRNSVSIPISAARFLAPTIAVVSADMIPLSSHRPSRCPETMDAMDCTSAVASRRRRVLPSFAASADGIAEIAPIPSRQRPPSRRREILRSRNTRCGCSFSRCVGTGKTWVLRVPSCVLGNPISSRPKA